MTVNGVGVGPHQVPEGLSMNDYLREYLGLTGTKFGCGIGMCSACVVILEDAAGTSRTVHTCINGAEFFEGKSIRTIEGIARVPTFAPPMAADAEPGAPIPSVAAQARIAFPMISRMGW